MKYLMLLISLVMVGCSNTVTEMEVYDESDSVVYSEFIDSTFAEDSLDTNYVERTYIKPTDSLSKMLDFMKYIDSMDVVEKVSDNFIKLKESNEKLETTLTHTKRELRKTKDELVDTKIKLEKSEKIVKSIIDTASVSNFDLLPIDN